MVLSKRKAASQKERRYSRRASIQAKRASHTTLKMHFIGKQRNRANEIIKYTHRAVFQNEHIVQVEPNSFLPTVYEIADLNVYLFGNQREPTKFRSCFFYTFRYEKALYLFFKIERYSQFTLEHAKNYALQQYGDTKHDRLGAKTFREKPVHTDDETSLKHPVVKLESIKKNNVQGAYADVEALMQQQVNVPAMDDTCSWFVYFLRYISLSHLFESPDGIRYKHKTHTHHPMFKGATKGAWVMQLGEAMNMLHVLKNGQIKPSSVSKIRTGERIRMFNKHVRTGHEIFIPDSDTLLTMFTTFMNGLPASIKMFS
jgi:hypothetical protein